MNWYSIFYWLTVANNVNNFITTFAILATIGLGVCIFVRICLSFEGENVNVNTRLPKAFKRWYVTFTILTVLFWALFAFIPTKKDCLLIIAGGSVGNFITTDSSAKALPSDITKFLHQSLQSEIKDLSSDTKKELGVQNT